jgi:hypothetical protein
MPFIANPKELTKHNLIAIEGSKALGDSVQRY